MESPLDSRSNSFNQSFYQRRSNHSILKEINHEYSLERRMLKLKLHTLATCCEQLTHWKRPWCWERLRAKDKGATEDETVDGITNSMDTSVSKLRVIVKDREAFHAAVHGVPKSRTRLIDWTTATRMEYGTWRLPTPIPFYFPLAFCLGFCHIYQFLFYHTLCNSCALFMCMYVFPYLVLIWFTESLIISVL